MILFEWDAPEGDPGQSCVHLFARILSTSFTSVSIFFVCCYSSVSISMVLNLWERGFHRVRALLAGTVFCCTVCGLYAFSDLFVQDVLCACYPVKA